MAGVFVLWQQYSHKKEMSTYEEMDDKDKYIWNNYHIDNNDVFNTVTEDEHEDLHEAIDNNGNIEEDNGNDHNREDITVTSIKIN